MKKLAGLVIVLAVLILGGYYGMGVLKERTIKKNIEVVNRGKGFFADISDYNRGWFTSTASIKWSLHIPERVAKDAQGNLQTVPAQDYQVDMPDIKIYHGPIIFSDKKVHFGMGYANTEFPFPPKYNQQFDEQFTKESIKPQLDLSIFVNYLCKSTVELSLPAFKLIAKNGTVFDWKGMESGTTISSHRDRVDGEVIVDGMVFSRATTKITMGKVTTEYDLHLTPSGLYLGNARFRFPSLNVSVQDKKFFDINELDMSSDSDIEDSLFSTHFNLSLKSLFADEKTYGPGEFEITLRNLDADVLARINEQASAMQNGTETERQQAMIALLPEVPKLFSKGAELEVSKCSLKMPEGMIEGNLLVSLPAGDSSNPFELIQKIQGNAKFKMPVVIVKQLMQQSVLQQMSKHADMQQALIQQLQTTSTDANQTPPTPEQLAVMQADKQIATLEQNGLIVLNGSDYTIEMNLEQGKFQVNGKPFDPAMTKF